MTGRGFGKVLREQKDRLRHTFSERDVVKIEEEHFDLRQAFRKEGISSPLAARRNDPGSLKAGWAALVGRLPNLGACACGLATLFPGASTVEAGFSLVKWEKDEFRQQLSNLPLEGILQCKQFGQLQELSRKG